MGIRWEQADAAVAVAGSSGVSVRGLRNAALLAVMSDGLLRISEANALRVADLAAESANTLTIRRSKTDQGGDGPTQHIGGQTVPRRRASIDAAGITGCPMFQRLHKAGWSRGRLSTVSIRAIGQRLHPSEASVVEMQTTDRWQSPSMPSQYAHGAVAKLRCGA